MIRVLGEDSGILHESSENFPLCHCAGVGSSSLSGTGVVFKGCQDRIRPGSRLELESSSRGVRTGYGQGQGWSWSRLRGVSGQDRPGSRLELESSSRGVRTGYGQGQGWSWSRLRCWDVRTGYGQGQGWSWSRLRGVSGQDTARVKAGAGVVFEGCQGRIRPGSRLELESSSRGVRAGYGQGQGWSWSRLRGMSGQDTARVKAGAGVVFDVGMSGQDTARVKAGAGVVFEGCQGRIRPGSRLELESSSMLGCRHGVLRLLSRSLSLTAKGQDEGCVMWVFTGSCTCCRWDGLRIYLMVSPPFHDGSRG